MYRSFVSKQAQNVGFAMLLFFFLFLTTENRDQEKMMCVFFFFFYKLHYKYYAGKFYLSSHAIHQFSCTCTKLLPKKGPHDLVSFKLTWLVKICCETQLNVRRLL